VCHKTRLRAWPILRTGLRPVQLFLVLKILSLAHSLKICNKMVLKIPQHLSRVATLPCEILKH